MTNKYLNLQTYDRELGATAFTLAWPNAGWESNFSHSGTKNIYCQFKI